MAYQIVKQGDTVQTYILEVQCDTLQDLEELKAVSSKWAAGSSCFVLEDASVWMLGIDKIWHKI